MTSEQIYDSDDGPTGAYFDASAFSAVSTQVVSQGEPFKGNVYIDATLDADAQDAQWTQIAWANSDGMVSIPQWPVAGLRVRGDLESGRVIVTALGK